MATVLQKWKQNQEIVLSCLMLLHNPVSAGWDWESQLGSSGAICACGWRVSDRSASNFSFTCTPLTPKNETFASGFISSNRKTAIAPLFDEIPIHRNSETRVVKEWSLPKGLEGRWHFFGSLLHRSPAGMPYLAESCCLIAPSGKSGKLYDWIAERGAPGLLAHLWLTMRKRMTK